jgi:phytoene synthase
MPRTKRPGTRALYAFCRKTDDIVDRPSEGDPSRALQHWRTHALHAHPQINDLVVLAWRDTLHQHQIPVHYAHQLIDGVATDLHKNRYQTFEELSVYAYQVASTVGLMSMHITGFDSAEALPYAIKLGVALQMTNILRDVGEDARNGRVYLPQVELAHFGLTDADLQAGQITPAWRAFMRHQIARNRQLYQQALPGIAHLHADGQLAIAAAAVLYREILTEIEHNEYDVFSRRAFVSGKRKLVLLAKTWWQLRRHIPL